LNTGQQLRQHERLTLVGNQRVTLRSNSRLRVWREIYRPFGYWDAILTSPVDVTGTSSKAVPGLTYPLQANSMYDVELKLHAFEGNANTMTFQLNFTGTATGTINFIGVGGVNSAVNLNTASATFFGASATGSIFGFSTVKTTTDGVLSVQVNPTASSTFIVYTGAVMKIKKLT